MKRPFWIRRGSTATLDERGTTVLEVSIVTVLLVVALVACLTTLTSFQRSSAGSDIRLENLTEARAIADTLTRDLRTATRPAANASPFLVADPMQAKFYANLERTTGPKLVTVAVDATTGTLKETVVNPAGTAPAYTYGGAPIDRLIGTYIVNSSADAVLEYYDRAGVRLQGTPATGPLSVAQLNLIESVRLNLTVRKANSLAVPGTTVRTTVRLPNVQFNPRQGA